MGQTALVMKQVKAAKRSLVSRIKKLTAPHLYDSGYVSRQTGEFIKVYAPKAGLWDADYLDDCMFGGPDAVTDYGFVDAGCGGMIETPFCDVPVEDLATFLEVLEKFDFTTGRFGE